MLVLRKAGNMDVERVVDKYATNTAQITTRLVVDLGDFRVWNCGAPIKLSRSAQNALAWTTTTTDDGKTLASIANEASETMK